MNGPDTGSPAALLELLRARRSVFKFRPEPVPDTLVLQALEAGRWAPNHKLTEPWRFTLLGPETKAVLAPRFAELAQRKLPPDATPERRAEALAMSRAKWEGKPVVVVVSQTPEADDFRREEDYAAVACAIQNVQLAAWALGLGSQWSTGALIRDPEAMAQAGIPPEERVVGLIFLGFPAVVPEARRRPLDEVLRRVP
jgi:nitroreductase